MVRLSMMMVLCAWLISAHAASALMVVASHSVAESEYVETRKALEQAGIVVMVAGIDNSDALGYHSLRVRPDLVIGEAKSDVFDAIIVIGGAGAVDDLWDHPDLQLLLKNAAGQHRLVAGICAGSVVLAKSGVLKGYKATTFPNAENLDEFKQSAYGVQYVTDEVVVDGLFITANGPGASVNFGRQVAQTILTLKK